MFEIRNFLATNQPQTKNKIYQFQFRLKYCDVEKSFINRLSTFWKGYYTSATKKVFQNYLAYLFTQMSIAFWHIIFFINLVNFYFFLRQFPTTLVNLNISHKQKKKICKTVHIPLTKVRSCGIGRGDKTESRQVRARRRAGTLRGRFAWSRARPRDHRLMTLIAAHLIESTQKRIWKCSINCGLQTST